MAKTISVAAGNWSANGAWDEGSPPANTDDVTARVGGDSGNLTNDITNQACRSLDFTNYTGLFTQSASCILNIGGAAAGPSDLALKLVPGMSVTRPTTATLTFVTSAAAQKVTTAGVLGNGPLNFNGTGGWVLQDSMTMGSTVTLTLTKGTLNTNAQTISCGLFNSSGSQVRTLTLDGTTINITSATATQTVWTMATASNLSFTSTGSVINLTGVVSTGARTFAGGGQTFGALRYQTTGGSGLTITGANSFSELTVTSAARTLTLPASTTTTATATTLTGIPGGLLSIVSSTGGTAATLSVASGTVRFNHCSIQDLTCTGGATFEAYDSINVSGNTGITFKRAPRLALTGVG